MSAAPLIPRSVLFGNPDRLNPTLSPDGQRIAFLAPYQGQLNVWAGPIDGAEAKHLEEPGRLDTEFKPVTTDTCRGVRTFAWAFDSRHVLFSRDRDGDENAHLFAANLADGSVRDLTPFDTVQARIVALEPRQPNSVLVGLNLRTPGLHDVHHLELGSGRLTPVAQNPGFTSWVADPQLRVRAAVAPVHGTGLAIMARVRTDAPWTTLHEVTHEDTSLLRVFSFTADGQALLVLSSRDAETTRLLRLEVATGEQQVLFADPGHDVVGVGTDPRDGRAQFVIVQRERMDVEVLDPELAEDFQLLRRLHRGDLSVLSRDRTDRRWLVQFNTDNGPAEYYHYDRRDRRARFLFTHCDALRGLPLSRIEPFTFEARDGLRMHGYLTFPVGVPRRGLPTVLVVHGGPWNRDIWGYRAEPQWMANRGYLVVQINFRGSTGYGKQFVNAGDRQWGAAMHDDLVDGVRWVVDRGLADPGRVAVYGGSYGGYAALVGATFTPEVFRCAVAMAAPSDLRTFLADIPPHWRLMADRLARRIGDPATEPEFLWSRSPLSRIDQLRIPLLIVQGANDPRVLTRESEQIVAELRRRGIAHEYLLFPDEGHGLVTPANRMTFYAAAERFLAEHLGGRCENGSG